MGTLLGTMCGFVSAVLLTPSQGETTGGLPAAPGVVSFALDPVAITRRNSTFAETIDTAVISLLRLRRVNLMPKCVTYYLINRKQHLLAPLGKQLLLDMP